MRSFASLLLSLLCAALLVCSSSSAQTPDEAQSFASRGDWIQAETAWRALTRADPNDFRYWTSLGVALAHQEKWNEAFAAYGKARQLAPGDGQTNLNLGLAYFKSGQLSKAVAPFRTAVRAMPQMAQAHLLLGMSLWGTQDFAGAVPSLLQARQLGLDTTELNQVLAQCYIQMRQTEQAESELERMLRADPNSASVHFFLGEAEDAAGHSDRAVAEFRQAIVRNPNLPDVHFALGYVFWKDKNLAGAEPEFRNELALAPEHNESRIYLADVLLKTDRKADAAPLLTQANTNSPSGWLLALDRGISYAEAGNTTKAINQLEQAIKLAPNRGEPHYRLGKLYRSVGQEAKAAEQLQIVSRLHKQEEDRLIDKLHR